MGGKEILQIDFAGDEEQIQKEIEPERLRAALQQMQQRCFSSAVSPDQAELPVGIQL